MRQGNGCIIYLMLNDDAQTDDIRLMFTCHLRGSLNFLWFSEIKSEQGDMIQDILVELSNHNER